MIPLAPTAAAWNPNAVPAAARQEQVIQKLLMRFSLKGIDVTRGRKVSRNYWNSSGATSFR